MSKQQNCMPGGAGGGLSCTCLQQEDLMKRGRELQLLNYSRTLQIYIYIYIYICIYTHRYRYTGPVGNQNGIVDRRRQPPVKPWQPPETKHHRQEAAIPGLWLLVGTAH